MKLPIGARFTSGLNAFKPALARNVPQQARNMGQASRSSFTSGASSTKLDHQVQKLGQPQRSLDKVKGGQGSFREEHGGWLKEEKSIFSTKPKASSSLNPFKTGSIRPPLSWLSSGSPGHSRSMSFQLGRHTSFFSIGTRAFSTSLKHASELKELGEQLRKISNLSLDHIEKLGWGDLSEIPSEQLAALSFRQRMVISDEQRHGLSQERLDILDGEYVETRFGRMDFEGCRPQYQLLEGDTHKDRLEVFLRTPSDEISTVSPKSLREMAPSDFVRIRPDQIKQLNFDQIAFLKKKHIAALKPDHWRALHPLQIGAFSPEQRENIPSWVYSVLSPGQRNALTWSPFETEHGRLTWSEVTPSKYNNFSPITLTGLPKLQTSTPLNEVGMLFPGRGIRTLETSQGIENAAHVLLEQSNKSIVLVTGFNVDKGMPETDGPAGTILLGRMLEKLGKSVTYVSDQMNAVILEEGLQSLGANSYEIISFEKPLDAGDSWDVEAEAGILIDKLEPDTVMAIETPGRGASGIAKNMRGVPVSDFNEKLDAIMNVANDRSRDGHRVSWTIGVGDGGNEIGMGVVSDFVPLAIDGSEMASQVPTDILVTASVSNWGAEAIAGAMAKFDGRLDLLHTARETEAVLRATVKAGAVDGVSRLREATVDGFSLGAQLGWRKLMGDALMGTPERIVVGVMDSSNGGIWAAKILQSCIQKQTGHPVQLVIGVDHANAPYGVLDQATLGVKTNSVLKTLDAVLTRTTSYTAIAMACNTACTGIDYRKDINTPTVDLIETTAKHMLQNTGKHIVSLSTSATAGLVSGEWGLNRVSLGAYGKALKDSDITITEIGASNKDELEYDLATLVNRLTGSNPPPTAEISKAVSRYVDLMPVDTDVVYLTCTHYPALQDWIEDAISKRTDWHNKDASIPRVINPMSVQAEAVVKRLSLDTSQEIHSSTIYPSPPVIVTSAKGSKVYSGEEIRGDAVGILDRADIRIVDTEEFPLTEPQEVLQQVFRPIDPSEGTLHAWYRLDVDGRVASEEPIYAEIRKAELAAYKALEEEMGDQLPKAFDNVLRAVNDEDALEVDLSRLRMKL